MKCRQCPSKIDDGELCGPCSVELAHLILDAEPKRVLAKCQVCGTPYLFTEARVLRRAKDPRANASYDTPDLCWVCAHLHLSAHDAQGSASVILWS